MAVATVLVGKEMNTARYLKSAGISVNKVVMKTPLNKVPVRILRFIADRRIGCDKSTSKATLISILNGFGYRDGLTDREYRDAESALRWE